MWMAFCIFDGQGLRLALHLYNRSEMRFMELHEYYQVLRQVYHLETGDIRFGIPNGKYKV